MRRACCVGFDGGFGVPKVPVLHCGARVACCELILLQVQTRHRFVHATAFRSRLAHALFAKSFVSNSNKHNSNFEMTPLSHAACITMAGALKLAKTAPAISCLYSVCPSSPVEVSRYLTRSRPQQRIAVCARASKGVDAVHQRRLAFIL